MSGPKLDFSLSPCYTYELKTRTMEITKHYVVNLDAKLSFDVSLLYSSNFTDAEGRATGAIVIPAECMPLEILESAAAVKDIRYMYGIPESEFEWFHRARNFLRMGIGIYPHGWHWEFWTACYPGPLWIFKSAVKRVIRDIETELEYKGSLRK